MVPQLPGEAAFLAVDCTRSLAPRYFEDTIYNPTTASLPVSLTLRHVAGLIRPQGSSTVAHDKRSAGSRLNPGVRYPHPPPEDVNERFGRRFDGAGRQLVVDECENDPELLPPERFADERLRTGPPYISERMREAHIDFFIRKGCAGLGNEYRVSPERAYRAMQSGEFPRREEVAVRWALDGMRAEEFGSLHSVGMLTIDELARMVRILYPLAAPWRTWLNQWARDPGRAMPTEENLAWELEAPDELDGFDLRELERGDERRIDEDGTTYVKLNGIVYFIRTDRLEEGG